ncbi:class I SAM-dependent methyltransferase [Scytonema sp. PCC 10023]|uniref:class I SAM-dependent methyltransferase n=1 Tax=Scytonema sp. PCC 10023 TaxID=1680591 RepID=UPI0039C730B1
MVKQSLIDFTQVDRSNKPTYFVSYLDTLNEMEWIKAYKSRAFARLELQPGDRILDVGCGTGDDIRTLAQVVGNTGQAVGVDSSQTMIAEAVNRTKGLNLSVEYLLGDAHNLSFSNNTFDACRAERIFQYLAYPRKALAEMIRVTRPGGRIVVQEPDWETLLLDAPDRSLTRKILNFWCDTLNSGWIGRQLPALFNELGLIDIAINIDTFTLTKYSLANEIFHFSQAVALAQEAGIVSKAESVRWLGDLEASDRAGRFFSALTAFIVSGRKP